MSDHRNTENALREALLCVFKETLEGDDTDDAKRELLVSLTRQVKGCLTAYEVYRSKRVGKK